MPLYSLSEIFSGPSTILTEHGFMVYVVAFGSLMENVGAIFKTIFTLPHYIYV